MPRLSLSLLGPPLVALNGEPVRGLKSIKVTALLAYLAVESGRAHRREALAGLLWPDVPQDRALSSLRAALYDLRRHIADRQADPAFLLIDRESVQFNVRSDHYLDVEAMAGLLGEPLEAGGERGLRRWWEAVALYRGPFLQDFPLADSELFEEWVLPKRQGLEQQVLAALEALPRRSEGLGDWASAERYLRRWLELAPWAEEAYRDLMRLLAFTGRRGQALSEYDRCRRALAAELGVEPQPETVSLYRSIRQGAMPPAPVPPLRRDAATTPLPRERDAQFVAREQQLGGLERLLQCGLAGSGRVAFVIGEPGSGKTALAREFARRAIEAHAGLPVAFGSGNAYTGPGDPYLPFLQVLGMLTGDPVAGPAVSAEHRLRLDAGAAAATEAVLRYGEDLVDALVSARSLLARAVAHAPADGPWLARLAELAGSRYRQAAVPGAHQAALLEAYARVMRAFAQEAGLVLVLDDLQWADGGSVDLFCHLGKGVADSRMLLVGIYRSGGALATRGGLPHPLETVVHELLGAPGAAVIDLDEAQGREFVDALLDREPNRLGPGFRDQLLQRTGGHALFTAELLHGLRDRGDVVRDESGRWVEGEAVDWRLLPLRVEGAIADRLHRLPAALRRLLAVASVQGEDFAAEVVARVQGADEARTRRALSGPLSERHRLVVAQGVERLGQTSLSHYRFRHYLFQGYLYRNLDPVERSHLHEATGEALEGLYGERRGDVAAALAWHFEEAGLPGRAAVYLCQVGERAVRLCAYGEAAATLAKGLALLEGLPDSPERAQTELSLQMVLGTACSQSLSPAAPEVIAAYSRAVELSRRVGDTPQLRAASIRLAGAYRDRGDYSRALRVWQQTGRTALDDQDSLAAAEAHLQLGYILVGTRPAPEVRTHLEVALAIYEAHASAAASPTLHDPAPAVTARLLLGHCLWYLGCFDQAMAHMRRAVAEAGSTGRPFTLAGALDMEFSLAYYHSENADALGESMASLEAMLQEGWVHLRLCVRICRAFVRAVQGDRQEGFVAMRRSLDEFRAGWHLSDYPFYAGLLARACLKQGWIEEGLRAVEEAQEPIGGDDVLWTRAESLVLKGKLLLQRGGPGDEAAGEQCLRQAIVSARAQAVKPWELMATTALARVLARQGKRDEARDMLAAICGWFTEGFDAACLVEARGLLAQLA